MKNMVLAAALVLACTPSIAWPGVDVSWNGCAPSPAASEAIVLACDGTDQQTLWVSFRASQALPNFIGLTARFDLQDESGPLSPFWNFSEGACNEGSFNFSPVRGVTSPTCPLQTPWGVVGSTRDTTVALNAFENRESFECVVVRGAPFDLPAGVDYFAIKLTIDGGTALGCAGCNDRVVIALNLFDLSSTTHPLIDESAPLYHAPCIQVNGASPGLCAAVPIRNLTWGSVKSMYR